MEVDVEGLGERLAHVEGLERCQFFGVGLDQVGQGEQGPFPGRRLRVAPLLLEGAPRVADGQTSSASPAAIRAITSPVPGSRTSIVFSDRDSRRSPLITMLWCVVPRKSARAGGISMVTKHSLSLRDPASLLVYRD
jgi:hypothetical protein